MRFHEASLALAVGATVSAMSTWAAEGDRLGTAEGGPGGVPFVASCPRYSYLVGFSGGIGDDLDSIKPVCAELNTDRSRGRFTEPESERGGQRVAGNLGGTGGQPFEAVCADATAAFVRELAVTIEGVDTRVIDTVTFYCAPIAGRVARPLIPDVTGFNVAGRYYQGNAFGGRSGRRSTAPLTCPSGTTFAGIHGRAGQWVDRLGPICRSIEAIPAPPTLSSDRPLVTSPAAARATQPAGPNPVASVPIQQGGDPTFDTRGTALQENELLCRGGAPYPTGRYGQVPGNAQREIHVVFVRASESVARPDGSGLEPGRCGFPNRAAAEIASLLITVDVGSQTSLQGIEALKDDATRYWSFLVERNDALGMMEATENHAWTPPGAGRSTVQQVVAARPFYPPNLFALNDAETVTVGERRISAREAKLEVETALDGLSEPTRSFALCAIAAKECGR